MPKPVPAPLRLHVWGLMRGMREAGTTEWVEAAMVSARGHKVAMRHLSTIVGRVTKANFPERVYRVGTVCEGLLEIRRTA